MLCFFGIINILWFQVILGEEVAASKLTLFDITKQICDAVQARAEQGLKLMLALVLQLFRVLFMWFFDADKNHGVILIPEGLVETIPELYALLQVFKQIKDLAVRT